MSYYAKTKDPGVGVIYNYTVPWDADMIYGCNCDTGYYGPACQLRLCPSGDDPLTGVGVSTVSNPTQFNEVQRVTCSADSGTFTLTFRGKTTSRIPYNAKASELQLAIEALPTIGTGATKIVMFGSQACSTSSVASSWTVEFTQNFGNLPLMVADGKRLSFQGAATTPFIAVSKQTAGNKEDAQCSRRGTCDSTTGYCGCSTNFDTSDGYNRAGTRGDCGYAVQTIQQCPGLTSCSAHGQCSGNPTYVCSCSDGWTGADCSERTCPKTVAWFTLPSANDLAHVTESVECGNIGFCDRITGSCVCSSGFTGTSCSRMVCPGTPTECSGHGRCLDMMALSSLATINGDAAGFSYGAIPNNPLTWDANMVYGCFCDTGYQGYDCSLKTCPVGDDPLTVNQFDERQIINCVAPGTGSLVFTFRQKTGFAISASANLASVKAMLEAIPGVGLVNVDLYSASDPDQLCTTTASGGVIVTFLTTHGDVPMMKVTSQGVTSITIQQFQQGTKENKICSGRGLCDTSTGLCSCFVGFGSSDGMGGSGSFGDCGYVQPIVAQAQS